MALSTLLTIVVVLILLGVALWLVETYIPMAQPFRVVIRVVVVLCLIVWLLSVFGLWQPGALR